MVSVHILFIDPKISAWTPNKFEQDIADSLQSEIENHSNMHKELYDLLLVDKRHADDDNNKLTSLRCLDWLVTNYSRDKLVCLGHSSVHENYKDMLMRYQRRYFDPFRRRQRIQLKYMHEDSEVEIVTTLGQLNFLTWAIRTNVLEYCKKHRSEIENHHLDRKQKGLMGAQKKRKRGKADMT